MTRDPQPVQAQGEEEADRPGDRLDHSDGAEDPPTGLAGGWMPSTNFGFSISAYHSKENG